MFNIIDAAKKVKRFYLERKKWIKAGNPKRTADEINNLFDNICSKCEHFKKKGPHEGKCGICGCRLTRKKEYLNKLAWATTSCPLDNPKWIALPEYSNIELSEQEIKEAANEQQLDEQKEKELQKEAPKKSCGCSGK